MGPDLDPRMLGMLAAQIASFAGVERSTKKRTKGANGQGKPVKNEAGKKLQKKMRKARGY